MSGAKICADMVAIINQSQCPSYAIIKNRVAEFQRER